MNDIERFDIDECGAVMLDPKGQYADADVTQELYEALDALLKNYRDNNRKGLGISPIFRASRALAKARGES